jgi:predicted O-methyltransferase YrrM
MKKIFTPQALQQILQHVDGWLSPHEARLLYEIARLVPVSGDIVEIGSWKGKSTIALAFGIHSSRYSRTIAAVDPHEGIVLPGQKQRMESTRVAFINNIRAAGVQDKVRPYVMTSRQAANKWNKSVAVLFIDGIHDYQHAKEDFELWAPFVANKGIIAFHDCFCGVKGVGKAARELLLSPDVVCDVGTVGSILYGIKGRPAGLQSFIVRVKIVLIVIVQSLYNSKIFPQWLQNVFIHRLVRLLLLCRYTREVYL